MPGPYTRLPASRSGYASGSARDQFGRPIQSPPRSGLTSGDLHGEDGPSAFDRFFGSRMPTPPVTRVVNTVPASQALGHTGAALAGISPSASAATLAVGATKPVTTVTDKADWGAFGRTRQAPTGGTEVWQRSQTTGGAWAPTTGAPASQVALPANPADRALLMETRARDAAAKLPAPVSIPGGDPVARAWNNRAWNNAHGTGHPNTPEPGAGAFARPINPVDPSAVAVAGTGRTLITPYGTASSTGGTAARVAASAAPSAPSIMPAGVNPTMTLGPTDLPATPATAFSRALLTPPASPQAIGAPPAVAPVVPPWAPPKSFAADAAPGSLDKPDTSTVEYQMAHQAPASLGAPPPGNRYLPNGGWTGANPRPFNPLAPPPAPPATQTPPAAAEPAIKITSPQPVPDGPTVTAAPGSPLAAFTRTQTPSLAMPSSITPDAPIVPRTPAPPVAPADSEENGETTPDNESSESMTKTATPDGEETDLERQRRAALGNFARQ